MSSHEDIEEDIEEEIRRGFQFTGKSIASGCSASVVESLLGGRTFLAGKLRERINDTIQPPGGTLLMLVAARRGDEDESVRVAQVLQKYGADVNQPSTDELGSSPLAFAAADGKWKYLQWLVRQGAKIDHRLRTSPSLPIYLASQNNHPECVAILGRAAVEQGKEWTMNELSMHGFSPIYRAFQRGFVEVVGALTMCGADLRQGFALYWAPSDYPVDVGAPEFDPSSDMQPHYSLMQAMLSFTTLQCAHCQNISTELNCCSRCHMAHYCSKECQKANWKIHKHCCKRLRKGQDMVYGEEDEPRPLPLPSPKNEPFGFDIPFAGDDFKSEENDPDRPVWEYNAGTRGEADWRRYPAYIEESLESMLIIGGPRFMYKPGEQDAEGKYERDRSPTAHPGVATNYVYFCDMLEREYYTGAIRAVRRNGSREPLD